MEPGTTRLKEMTVRPLRRTTRQPYAPRHAQPYRGQDLGERPLALPAPLALAVILTSGVDPSRSAGREPYRPRAADGTRWWETLTDHGGR